MELDDRLMAILDATPGRDAFCGAIRISRNGSVLFQRAYGRASVQLNVPNTLRSRFHIASMTKMFIAAAVVRLSQDRILSIDAHPSRYVPRLSVLHPDVTLKGMLTHTAGLADIYDAPDLRQRVNRLVTQKQSLLDCLAELPPLTAPGKTWRYSSTGFLLLGYVLERAATAPFADVISTLLLEPLGMADTGADDPFIVNPRRSAGHVSTSRGWRNAAHDALAEVEGPREFFSTVGDIDRWANAMLAGEVLDDEGLALTFAPYARIGAFGDLDPDWHYGLGWFLGDGFRWIGGIAPGFRSALWQFPEQRLNVTMLWNNERIQPLQVFAGLRPILLGE